MFVGRPSDSGKYHSLHDRGVLGRCQCASWRLNLMTFVVRRVQVVVKVFVSSSDCVRLCNIMRKRRRGCSILYLLRDTTTDVEGRAFTFCFLFFDLVVVLEFKLRIFFSYQFLCLPLFLDGL